jgi:PKD repeat protein
MRSDPWAAALLALAAACEAPLASDSVASPDTVTAQPISITTIAVSWSAAPAVALAGYRIERRENLQGPFSVVAEGVAAPPYFDTGLKSDTYYGYRVETMTKLGRASIPSVVAGARTPPSPGIVVRSRTLGKNVDSDGYTAMVRGVRDSVWASLGPTDARRFSPLAPGRYAVELRGVAANCVLAGAATDSVDVTDQGLNTLVTVQYDISCRDPHRGQITTTIVATGDSLDGNGYRVRLTGIADSAALPDSLRIVSRQHLFPAGGGTFLFEDLFPGDYELELEDVAAQCTVSGATTRSVHATALGNEAVSYALDCPRGTPNTGNRPFVLRNRWTPNPVASGQHTILGMTLDLSATPGQTVAGAQGVLRYNQAALRFDSAKAGALAGNAFNGQTPGLVNWIVYTTGTPPAGVVSVAQVYFTAVGSPGLRSPTRTDALNVVAGDDQQTPLDTLVRAVEDTVLIAGGSNQAPRAEANGPYTGAAGTSIAFSATGSSDPDGTIASYAWSFGDGATATSASPTHSYAAPGSYTATLVVTDNLGATGTDQAMVTVTGTGGGGNQPPVAHANGPYTGSAGGPIAFSAAGSSDPDGSIASYSWTFGDGGTASGASPSHSYASAGTYTATLTVTDNQGASASDPATVTVTNMPFTWRGTFGSVSADSVVALSITLDLSGDIPETSGAEALATFAVDSLKWDPTVLRYYAFNWGAGGAGVINPTDAESAGRLIFSSFTLPEAGNHGVIPVATIRFKRIGTAGRTTTTRTALGALRGTAATGSYDYRPRTAIQEATFTAP